MDNIVGTAGNDTINGTGTTLTALDSINGGDGVDTLAIADPVGVMGTTLPAGVNIAVEKMTVNTAGALGQVASAGTSATAQVNKYDISNAPANSASVTIHYGSLSQTITTDASATQAELIAAYVLAINAMAGATVAAAGTGGDHGKVVVTGPANGRAVSTTKCNGGITDLAPVSWSS